MTTRNELRSNVVLLRKTEEGPVATWLSRESGGAYGVGGCSVGMSHSFSLIAVSIEST